MLKHLHDKKNRKKLSVPLQENKISTFNIRERFTDGLVDSSKYGVVLNVMTTNLCS